MDQPTICAVIPCYNEARTIASVVQGLRAHVSTIFVVDDGSTDDTASEASKSGAELIKSPSNQGKGAVLQTGLRQAFKCGFEWAFTLDGDGQHCPADIQRFPISLTHSAAPLVIGNRMPNAPQIPWLRRQVNRWMSRRLSTLAGQPLPDTQCGFRLVHLPTWSRLPIQTRRFQIESEMLLAFIAAGHRVEFVPIQVIPSPRKSRINPLTDTWLWFQWWIATKNRLASRPAQPHLLAHVQQ